MNVSNSFEHFVYFTYKLEWEIPKEIEPYGYLTLFLPKSFPINSQIFRIPIDKRNGFFEKTIDACVDDFFIDCVLRKSFLHIVRYSDANLKIVQDKIKKKMTSKKNNNTKNNKNKMTKKEFQEKFTRESIFLDAGVLFIPDRKETSITVDMGVFNYVTFSIQIDDELLSIPHIKKFAPTILHITKIENFFDNQIRSNCLNELSLDPIYFECQVGSNSYFLVPRYDKSQKKISIDATIFISPRKDESIIFRMFDNVETIPESTFIGSGLYINPNSNMEEEEEYDEELSNENQQNLIKSISEENLSHNENQKEEKTTKSHHHHHHHHSKSSQKDESFIQMMKKVEGMEIARPLIQFTSPLKKSLIEFDQTIKVTPEDNLISRKSSKFKEPDSGRKSRIRADIQPNIMCSPVSKTLQSLNSLTKSVLSTEVLPSKRQNLDEKPEYGYCQFYLFPERHATMKMISSTNDDSYKNVTISFDIYDPAARFPPPIECQEIKRPSTVHKRPPKSTKNSKEIIFDNYKYAPSTQTKNDKQTEINIFVTHNKNLFTDDLSKMFPEDSKILSIEKPTIKLLRWILSCPRFSPVSLKLVNFIQTFHKTTIHGFSHILNPCFKNCVRKSPDLITGFHFVSPKEEVFVLETRAYRPNKASLSLELFLRNEIPPETHIICNSSIVFPAPRLYCCTDNLIQRVEIPISLDDLLKINGLYFQKSENHKLFPIAQKLANLLQSKKTTEVVDAFPNFSEIKILEKRAPSLYATPIQKSLSTAPIIHAKGADFGDLEKENNNDRNFALNNNNDNSLPINDHYQPIEPKKIQVKDKMYDNNKERLTTFYLAKPGSSTIKQRSESVSMKSVNKNYNNRHDENLINSIYVRPPDVQKTSLKKAPRNISSTKPS